MPQPSNKKDSFDVNTDDDLYLNNGADEPGAYYPDVPEEQKQEIAQEQAAKAASWPILTEVADWFEEQANNCAGISNIQIAGITIGNTKYSREIHVEAQVLAFQLLEALIKQKAHEFEEFRSSMNE